MIVEHNTAVVVPTQSSSTPFNIAQAIEQYLPLVQKVARMAYHRYGRSFEHDDLVGYGHLGLVSAARKYAALEYDIRQAIDFAVYAEKRIWRSIEGGRDRMATIHRTHYLKIKRGEMARPKFVHDSEEFSLAEAISSIPSGSDDPADQDSLAVDEMTAWLRSQNSLWSKVVELRVRRGMTFEQISKLLDRSPDAASSLYQRAVNLLRWKYNHATYRHDDRTARRHRSLLRSV